MSWSCSADSGRTSYFKRQIYIRYQPTPELRFASVADISEIGLEMSLGAANAEKSRITWSSCQTSCFGLWHSLGEDGFNLDSLQLVSSPSLCHEVSDKMPDATGTASIPAPWPSVPPKGLGGYLKAGSPIPVLAAFPPSVLHQPRGKPMDSPMQKGESISGSSCVLSCLLSPPVFLPNKRPFCDRPETLLLWQWLTGVEMELGSRLQEHGYSV